MKRHFFLKKNNTIFRGRNINSSLNPVLKLIYGNGLSRVLIKADTESIRNEAKISSGNFIKAKYTLNMKNCSSIIDEDFSNRLIGPAGEEMKRASSFDLILFRIPIEYDEGKGSSIVKDAWYDVDTSFSSDSSTWYFAKTCVPWKPREETYDGNEGLDDGIYSIDFIKKEYEKYKNGEKSVIISEQHFELGNEDLKMDVTEEIENILNGSVVDHGFGIAFAPLYEETVTEIERYVAFFSERTNTVYHPFIEMDVNERIMDNRYEISPFKDNKLYLFTNIDNEPINLDEIPSCEINGEDYEVRQAKKGCYYVVLPKNKLKEINYTDYTDKWSKIAINGIELDDIEQDFNLMNIHDSFSKNIEFKNAFPMIYGLNNNDELERGEEREVTIDFVKKYENSQLNGDFQPKYKIYVKDGENDMTVFDYSDTDIIDGENVFKIYTEDMVPNKYYIDLKIKDGNNIKMFKDVLHFIIKSDTKNRFI